MKRIQITKYQCENCGEAFDSPARAKSHEEWCKTEFSRVMIIKLHENHWANDGKFLEGYEIEIIVTTLKNRDVTRLLHVYTTGDGGRVFTKMYEIGTADYSEVHDVNLTSFKKEIEQLLKEQEKGREHAFKKAFEKQKNKEGRI